MSNEVKMFDWQNMIIVDGSVYALTTKQVDNPFSSETDPCKLCEMSHLCSPEGHSPCYLLGARCEEYMTEVGRLLIKKGSGELQFLLFEDYFPQ